MSDEAIEYSEEDKAHFDVYVDNLIRFYDAMQEQGIITEYDLIVNRDTFDVRTSTWLMLPPRQMAVEVRDLPVENTVNLLEECDA